ncbi:MAG: ParB N-terminal domain-containing protein [Candidatus Caldarchaeum sp.]|nr:ParB N-terminal domain-containing protein [Candidatus Caldarchaeum sp.]
MKLRPWSIGLAEVTWLKPHEQSISTLVDKLAEEIKKDGRIVHPVIADASTGLVLDGTHRVEAAAKLNLPLIPVYAVDYFSPEIELCGWGRVALTSLSMESLWKLAEPMGFHKTEGLYSVKFLWSDGKTIAVTVDDIEMSKIYQKISMLEKRLQIAGIRYVRDKDLENLVLSSTYPFGYFIRPLTKQEVYDSVLGGYRLPPKSTRHLINRRPMFLYCPLEILREEDAERRFAEWVAGGEWVEAPAGIELDRRYDEKTLVFYREELRPLYPVKLLELVKVSTPRKPL